MLIKLSSELPSVNCFGEHSFSLVWDRAPSVIGFVSGRAVSMILFVRDGAAVVILFVRDGAAAMTGKSNGARAT